MKKPKVIIPVGLGINSHEELGYCFKAMGGVDVDFRLINEIIKRPKIIDKYQGMGLAGGFMMGDQLGAGQSIANRVRNSNLLQKLDNKLNDENFPIYAVCNSLQLLAKLDLFPINVGTVQNDSGKHETGCWDFQAHGKGNIWFDALRDYTYIPYPMAPISHGEGRIILDKKELEKEDKISIIRYYPEKMNWFYTSSRGIRHNPNGSIDRIAGLGWANNIALFPHMERLHHNYQRPDRIRVPKEELKDFYPPTYAMFKAAGELMRGNKNDKR